MLIAYFFKKMLILKKVIFLKKTEKIKKSFFKYTIILFGSLMFALSVNLFTLPSKIVTGGVSGIATVLYFLYGWSPGMVVALTNVIIGLIAYKELGMKFIADSLVGIIAIPLFMEMTSGLPPVCSNIMLNCIFGGILCGIGIGLTFSQGSTTGGTDIVSRISQKKMPHFSVGSLLGVIDFFIIFVSYLVFGDIELTMYGIITLFISTWIIDEIITRLNSAVVAYIITTREKQMKETIFEKLNRGVTVINAKGGYSNAEKEILMCVMKKKELEKLKNIMNEVEEKSFVIVSPSSEVQGEGFKYYR